MLGPRRTRSFWSGLLFLGLAAVFVIVTGALVLMDRDLTLLNTLTQQDGDSGSNVAFNTSATATAAAAPIPSPTPTPIPDDLKINASSALVVQAGSGSELFSREADALRQPASTVKIITALTVVEHLSPEAVITVTAQDVVDPVVESSMGLQAGDQLTVHDLLVGLLLPSGNDAANALARVIGERLPPEMGETPQERFVQEMNNVASGLGLENSKLLHPAGHDREGQGVTARDMAIAAEALLDRPLLRPIVAMREAEIRVSGAQPRVITVENTNDLLVHDNVYGIKTGTTEEAGQCLVVAYRDGEQTYIGVILGSQDRYGDARALFNFPAAVPNPAGSGEGTPTESDQPEQDSN